MHNNITHRRKIDKRNKYICSLQVKKISKISFMYHKRGLTLLLIQLKCNAITGLQQHCVIGAIPVNCWNGRNVIHFRVSKQNMRHKFANKLFL